MKRELEGYNELKELYTNEGVQLKKYVQFIRLLDLIDGDYSRDTYKMLYENSAKALKQALTPPTADEIVKELNEYYDVEFTLDDSTFEYIENDNYCLFYYDMSLPEFKYWKVDKQIMFSDNSNIEIAHKITSFFIQESESE